MTKPTPESMIRNIAEDLRDIRDTLQKPVSQSTVNDAVGQITNLISVIFEYLSGTEIR